MTSTCCDFDMWTCLCYGVVYLFQWTCKEESTNDPSFIYGKCYFLLIWEPCAGCSNYSSNFGDTITDFGMENIDMADKVKLEDSCVIVDNRMLYEVSRRIRKLRSYKVCMFYSLSFSRHVHLWCMFCVQGCSYAFQMHHTWGQKRRIGALLFS